MADKKTSIGGQALMEGIMMRGPEMTAMAVRRADGTIVTEEFATNNQVPKICKLPLIRGVYGMVTSLTVGYKCMMRSADLYAMDALAEEEAKTTSTEADTVSPPDAPEVTADTPAVAEETKSEPAQQKNDKKDSKEGEGVLGTAAIVLTVLLSVVLMLGLFMWLPTFLYDITLEKVTSDLPSFAYRLIRSASEALIRVIILIGYMLAISQLNDIKRTFMYHGAEHKTIFCYEKGLPLTVENIRPMCRFHPRCGTSFLILMVLVGILLGLLIPFTGWLRVVCKLALFPLTIGIGYELIKVAGRYDNTFTRIISAPGVWLQKITTKEPTDDMIECAIAAMEKVIPADREKDNW